MKKLLPLLLCFVLSSFSVARATQPTHMPARDTRSAQKNPTGQEADEKTLLNDAGNDEDVSSDNDDSIAGASDDEGESMNDDDGGDAPSDQETGDDDAGDDDGGGGSVGDQGE